MLNHFCKRGKMNSYYKIFVMSLLGLLLSVSVVSAANWYEGGTLHKATIVQWKRATQANKVATCADFIAYAHKNGDLKMSFSSMAAMKPYAVDLAKCIDETVRGIDTFDKESVTTMAALAMVYMGWMK